MKSTLKTSLLAVVVLLALLLAVVAGAWWHQPLLDAYHRARFGESGEQTSGQLWTCGMHPQVIQDRPGDCPICHMDLVPLKADAAVPAASPAEHDQHVSPTVMIDPVVVQNMGVRVAAVQRGALTQTIRAVGYLRAAEPRTYEVNLRISGWIEKLHADTEGMRIDAGQPLFELYSPELHTAVEEFILSRRQQGPLREVADAAARKLALFGLSEDQIAELAKLPQSPTTVTFHSPISGHLLEKSVVQGAAVSSGQRVMRVADLSVLWLDAQVYEQHLPLVRLQQPVQATVGGRAVEGTVTFVSPTLDPSTRTAAVRIELPNDDLALRPGMFATAQIRATAAGDALLVPREAVIDTGTRQIVFESLGEGRFAPREIHLGAAGDGAMVQVLHGLEQGQTIVTSGQFLLDSESRLREAIQKHLSERTSPPPSHAH